MRLRLRPYRPDDAPALFEAVRESQAEIFRWMAWAHPGYSLAEAREWLAERPRLFREGLEYEHAILVVADDGTERYAGGCGVNQVRPAEATANLGYWVRTSLAGRGLATAAARLLVDFAFTRTSLRRLEIVCATGNLASRRVAAKLGARDTGAVPGRLLLLGVPSEAHVFVLDRP